jgi:hypothetical protein
MPLRSGSRECESDRFKVITGADPTLGLIVVSLDEKPPCPVKINHNFSRITSAAGLAIKVSIFFATPKPGCSYAKERTSRSYASCCAINLSARPMISILILMEMQSRQPLRKYGGEGRLISGTTK